jgi:hypothetical protein
MIYKAVHGSVAAHEIGDECPEIVVKPTVRKSDFAQFGEYALAYGGFMINRG